MGNLDGDNPGRWSGLYITMYVRMEVYVYVCVALCAACAHACIVYVRMCVCSEPPESGTLVLSMTQTVELYEGASLFKASRVLVASNGKWSGPLKKDRPSICSSPLEQLEIRRRQWTVRNLVFLRNLLSKPKAFGTAIFGHAVLRVQNPVFFQCFSGFRARNLRFA